MKVEVIMDLDVDQIISRYPVINNSKLRRQEEQEITGAAVALSCSYQSPHNLLPLVWLTPQLPQESTLPTLTNRVTLRSLAHPAPWR